MPENSSKLGRPASAALYGKVKCTIPGQSTKFVSMLVCPWAQPCIQCNDRSVHVYVKPSSSSFPQACCSLRVCPLSLQALLPHQAHRPRPPCSLLPSWPLPFLEDFLLFQLPTDQSNCTSSHIFLLLMVYLTLDFTRSQRTELCNRQPLYQ